MNKCAYSSCNCPVKERDNYCSEYCYQAAMAMSKCECGHGDCETVPNIFDSRATKHRNIDHGSLFHKKYY